MRALRGLVMLAALGLLVTTVGCSSKPRVGQVQGTVTFKGVPVKEGLVTFLNPNEGGAYEAKLNEDGTFVITGQVVVAEYLVIVTPPLHLVDTSPGKTPPSMEEKPAPNIPTKYRMQGTTPLKAPVKEGKNDFQFEMTP